MAAIGRLALDTSVIVAALRRQPGIIERLRAAHELWVPLFALGELEYGAGRASHPERQREAVSLFMSGAGLLLPSQDTAVEYGRIKAQLARAGTPIPENDIWIAAQALEHQLPLATLDAYFDHIPGLLRPDWIVSFPLGLIPRSLLRLGCSRGRGPRCLGLAFSDRGHRPRLQWLGQMPRGLLRGSLLRK